MTPNSPCPYSPEFLEAQHGRLLAARERLERVLGARAQDDPHEGEAHADEAGARGDWSRDVSGESFHLGAHELQRSMSDVSRRQIHAVDAAIERLKAGRYGWDPEAGAWLRQARLAALPTARQGISEV